MLIGRRKIVRKLTEEVVAEAGFEGVYILLFQSPLGLQAYIGQSDDVPRRLREWRVFAHRVGTETAEKVSMRIVTTLRVSTKGVTTERAKKFVPELVEQGFINAFTENGLELDEGLRNKQNAVRPSTALHRFERHFRTPAQKKLFKRLFKKAFPL